MDSERGKFIAIEGIGGAGKSSLVRRLRSVLPGDRFVFTYEPGGTPFADSVRDLFKRTEGLTVFQQMLFVEIARQDNVLKVIRPALSEGRHVICDRFSASTFGYQVYQRFDEDTQQFDGALKLFNLLERHSTGGLEPDLWIFLDGPVEVCVSRRKHDKKDDGLDVFDERGVVFQSRASSGMNSFLSGSRGERVCRIDAGRCKDLVFHKALGAIRELTS